ncbi:MAG: efflux transporter outer membrane subunit [Verrucomicrobiales bacterium]|nr:efflux transporter outer membrane subunit [Verrucomicrobiales bacterium]
MQNTKSQHVGGTGKCRPGFLVACLSLAALQQGCVLNNLEKSDSAVMVGELPETWTGGSRTIPGAAITGWLSDFQSPQLTALVNEAVENNYDLSATLSRVQQAQERARIAGSDRVPAVNTGIRTTRSQNLRGAAFRSVRANNFSFSLDVSWEADLWGRVKNLRDSQWDLVTAETNVYEASRLSLAANVAKTAFEVIESQEQSKLIRQNLASLRTNLAILDSKLEAGDADDRTALEISLSRADIAGAKSRLLAEQRQEDAARRTLETLLGRYPSGEIKALKTLPRPSRKVPAGLPSELLLRRPDLLAAEARVDSALKELAASRKALLPAVAITSGAGTSTTDEFGDIFDIQNLVWDLGQNLTRPLYQGGRLKANIRLDDYEKDELVSSYAETAMVAFREVETALAAEAYLLGQADSLSEASGEALRSVGLSRSQYEQGLVDIITLLDSQRRAFDAQSSLLEIKLELLRNRVDLYLALGGDFDHPLIEK